HHMRRRQALAAPATTHCTPHAGTPTPLLAATYPTAATRSPGSPPGTSPGQSPAGHKAEPAAPSPSPRNHRPPSESTNSKCSSPTRRRAPSRHSRAMNQRRGVNLPAWLRRRCLIGAAEESRELMVGAGRDEFEEFATATYPRLVRLA